MFKFCTCINSRYVDTDVQSIFKKHFVSFDMKQIIIEFHLVVSGLGFFLKVRIGGFARAGSRSGKSQPRSTSLINSWVPSIIWDPSAPQSTEQRGNRAKIWLKNPQKCWAEKFANIMWLRNRTAVATVSNNLLPECLHFNENDSCWQKWDGTSRLRDIDLGRNQNLEMKTL